jgi:cobalt-zinc-cadmium efflux system membrane fusion protein
MKTKFIIAFFLWGLLNACSGKQHENKVMESTTTTVTSVSLSSEQIKNAHIQLSIPTQEMIGMTIYANGTIEVPPQNKTVITAQFGGFIQSLNVLDGMAVKKGQTLLTLEHPELIQLQQDYLEVVGNMEYLEAELDRQKTLVKQEAGSMKAFQQSKSQYNAALAKRSGLTAKLKMAGVNIAKLNKGELQEEVAVVAPFSGVVTKVAVNVGAYADPVEHLLEIIDLKHAHAEVIVFEKDVKKLKIGQHVSLNFTNEHEKIDATIFLIGKEIAKDRSVKVHCHLNKENSTIAPGSFFKASIYTGEAEQYCVPAEAVVEFNNENVVFCPVKTAKGTTTYIPESVLVIANDRDKTAFKFKNRNRSYSDNIVVSGAYDILSALLIEKEE